MISLLVSFVVLTVGYLDKYVSSFIKALKDFRCYKLTA